MPTLVWRRRPKSGTSAAAGGGGVRYVNAEAAAEAAVPEPVVSATSLPPTGGTVSAAAIPEPVVSAAAHVARPAVSSKRHHDADGNSGKKKKRKASHAKAAAAAKKKKPKATSERDLPTGVYKLWSGKFEASIYRGGKKTPHWYISHSRASLCRIHVYVREERS